ncbi:hypothetical protein K737_300674 [Holospora undulata HU1]|uniref:Uncharacterized protein n=1 Tax=Holospora undulata HU1 TaxID=1321371 RepID=A0A061JHP9_9PROT|nr:hypothetical protein K737_300674 [Holospora undulata HU1]
MCINHTSSFFNRISTVHFYLIAIIVGVLSSYFYISLLIKLAQIITDNFMKIFKCVSLPIISLSYNSNGVSV